MSSLERYIMIAVAAVTLAFVTFAVIVVVRDDFGDRCQAQGGHVAGTLSQYHTRFCLSADGRVLDVE